MKLTFWLLHYPVGVWALMQHIFTKAVYVSFFLITLIVYSIPVYSMLKEINTISSKKGAYIFLYSMIFLLVLFLAIRSLIYAFDLMMTA